MMKSFRITFILVCIFLLFGCNTTKVYDKEIKKPENYGFGLFEMSLLGEMKLIKSIQGTEFVENSGEFSVKISDVKIFDYNLFDEFKENFGNKDKITAITIAIEVSNNSPDTNDIYPLLGTLKTSTNEEVEVNLRRY